MDRIRILNTTIWSLLFEYSNSSNNSDQHWYHWTALEGWKECFCRILHYLASQTLIAENNVAILNSQCKLIFHTKTLLVPVGKIIHMYMYVYVIRDVYAFTFCFVYSFFFKMTTFQGRETYCSLEIFKFWHSIFSSQHTKEGCPSCLVLEHINEV